jgi:hypothetical protein
MSSTRAPATAPTHAACSPALPAPPSGADAHGGEQRVQYLFRHSLRAGRIHVLQHLIQRHRAQGAQP